MELDVMKEQWVEYDRKLDVSIHLNRQLLKAANMKRVQWPLRRFAFLVGLGAFTGLIGPIILGQFMYAHWTEPRFVLPALALDIWMIATLAASIRQVVMALQVDYDEPVAVIQRQLELLRLLRIRTIQWGLLTGQLVWWTPFLIVALRGVLNVDAYRVFGSRYLMANLAFSLAVIPIAVWVWRKFGQRFRWNLAGYNLDSATTFLGRLSEFEDETR